MLSNTTRLLIQELSLKQALIVNGGISAAVLIPCLLLLRHGPVHTGRRLEPIEVRWLYHPGFVWVWTWGFTASRSSLCRQLDADAAPVTNQPIQ